MIDIQKCRIALRDLSCGRYKRYQTPQQGDPDIILSDAIDELEQLHRLLDEIESYGDGGKFQVKGIGMTAADIAVLVKRARGGKKGETYSSNSSL